MPPPPILFSILRHPAAPQSIRLQAARALDDILVIIPRHLSAAPNDLQAAVQQRVLGVLALTWIYVAWAWSHFTRSYRRRVTP